MTARLLALHGLALGVLACALPAHAGDLPAHARTLAAAPTPSVQESGVEGLLAEATQTTDPLPQTEPIIQRTSLDAEIRVRGSLPKNLSELQAGEDAARRAIFHRERLGARFAEGPLDAHVQLQASGAFGEADPGAAQLQLPTVGLQQAVLHLHSQDHAWVQASLGRMILDYGSGRMIGAYDFHQTGNAFDGLQLQFTYQKYLQADVLAVKLRRNSTQTDQDRNLFGAYIVGHPLEQLVADLYFLYLIDGIPTGHAYLMTMGTRLDWQPAPWLHAEAEGALQAGDEDKQDQTTGPGRDRKSHVATAFFAQVTGIAQAGKGKVSFGPFSQLYSGEPIQPGNAPTSTAWRPLYPSLDQVVGLLQLFRQTNLMQHGARLTWNPTPDWTIGVDVRASFSHDNAPLPGFNGQTLSGQGGWRWLGTETDVRIDWQVLRSSQVLLAAGFFSTSGATEDRIGQSLASQILLQWTSRF